MSTFCYSCMNEIDGSFCPYCKKENTADSVAYRLKPGTILNKKFLVGNSIGDHRQSSILLQKGIGKLFGGSQKDRKADECLRHC